MTNLPDVQRAIEYIESHLKEALNIGEVAEYVGFSKYHFTRVFKEVTGYKPSEYYKGRKVTEAVNHMLENQCRVIDAAFEYGFNSPEVFTRSCLSAFNLSPSQIKKSVKDNHFQGIQPITPSSLAVYQKMKSYETEEVNLPAMLLKGYTYTTREFFPAIQLDNAAIRTLILGNELVYHLHWTTYDEYHHLIGVPVDLTSLSDEDFDKYIYKKIPDRHYLMFPLSQDSMERENLNSHIYDTYLTVNGLNNTRTFAVEAVKVNESNEKVTSLVYIPIHQGDAS